MPDLLSNIKLVPANQLTSAPPLKPSEYHRFSNDFRGYRSQIIHSNSRNTITKILRQSLTKISQIRLFTNFTTTGFNCLIESWILPENSDIYICLESYSTENFLCSTVLVCQISKYSCEVASTNNYYEDCIYFSLSQKKFCIIGGLM